MNELKTNNIIAWRNTGMAKPSFCEHAYCVVLGGSFIDFDGKQNNEYPIKS